MKRRRIFAPALVALAGAGLLAGCTSGHQPSANGGGSTTPSTKPAATTSPTPSTAQPSSMTTLPASTPDSVRASEMVVRLSDLPSGWTAIKDTTTPAQQRTEDAYFDNCLGVPPIESVTTKMLYSQFKQQKNLAYVYSTASSFKTLAEAKADGAALAGSKGASCEVAAMHKFLAPPPGGKIGAITGKPLSLPHGEFGSRIVTEITLKTGTKFLYYADQLGIVAGKYLVQLEFDSAVTAPDTSLEVKVAKAVFLRSLAAAA